MMDLGMMPESKCQIVHEVVADLSKVEGIKAIVLGGSYARGTAKLDSDIDLGLYYSDTLDISAVRQVVEKWGLGEGVVTGLYEWGPWVNGGAWFNTSSGEMDFLYRNIDQIERVIGDAYEGIFYSDFLQQPPFGFYSVTYLAETKGCFPLYDPEQVIERLKEKVAVYPSEIKKAIVQENLWSAEFTLLYAKKSEARKDLYTTAGSITRLLSCLTQVLFALNEEYFISDREALQVIERFKVRPEGYREKVEWILGSMDVQSAEELLKSIKDLAGDLYVPKYPL